MRGIKKIDEIYFDHLSDKPHKNDEGYIFTTDRNGWFLSTAGQHSIL